VAHVQDVNYLHGERQVVHVVAAQVEFESKT
jgi:hypothetical protein